MSLLIKHDDAGHVQLTGLQPEMAIAAQVVADVYRTFGIDCVITSALDGKHMEGSLHYVGRALDFRTKSLSPEDRPLLRDEVARRLGPEFDVVLEDSHLHIEHDVKPGETAVA